VLGDKDFTETAWCGRLQDLEGGKQGTPPKEALKAADYKGMFRKSTCSGSGMGLKVNKTTLTPPHMEAAQITVDMCCLAVTPSPFSRYPPPPLTGPDTWLHEQGSP